MTPQQSEHLGHLLDVITKLAKDKYAAGAAEHGGDLQDMPVGRLLDEAINENIDSLIYLLTAREKLINFKDYANNGHAVEGSGLNRPDKISET
jgi:hypothetical protein